MALRAPSLAIALTLAAAGLVAIAPAGSAATRTPVLEKRIIGYSVEHRPIVAYHLGDPQLKRTAVLIGQMHGDEHAGITVADSLIHGAVSVEGVNLWVIPTMNPDGNAANTRQNAHKVDLNRNWPYRWQHLSGRYYSGPKPLSEPESRAVHRFLVEEHPKYIVSLHQPLDGVDTGSGTVRERAFARTLAHNLHLPSTTLHCWSTCHGSMTDWYSHRKLGLAETVEFGSAPSHAYLVGTARKGIIAAMNGHFGSLARHDPHLEVRLAAVGASSVRATGWAYDIDRPAGRVLVRAYEGRDLVGHHGHWAQHPSPVLDRRAGLTGGHAYAFDIASDPGRHTYCLVVRNVGAGTKGARTCASIEIGATS
jgi:protein MpaA